MTFACENLMTDIKDKNLQIIGNAKTEITSAVKEGIKNDLIVNSVNLLKYFKMEVSSLCSCIGSSLMAAPERLLQREQMEIGSSFESLPQILLQEQ